MRFAKADAAVDEQRVIGFRRVLRDGEGRGIGKTVRFAAHEGIEGILGDQRRTAFASALGGGARLFLFLRCEADGQVGPACIAQRFFDQSCIKTLQRIAIDIAERPKNKYAVVNLSFINYRKYCLCHSVEAGEKLLFKINSVLSESINKKELSAHNNAAEFGLMLQYEDKDEITARIKELIYPVNYGFIEDIIAGDGSGQDVYVLGVDSPLERFTGRVIAVFHRLNDNEDKWILAPEGVSFTREAILDRIAFQEKFFDGVLYTPI